MQESIPIFGVAAGSRAGNRIKNEGGFRGVGHGATSPSTGGSCRAVFQGKAV